MKSRINIKTILQIIFRFGIAHHTQILLLGILLAALGLRLWGIGFDLPNLYHPDEDALIMPAINIIKTGNLEPTRLEYGSLHIYLLTAVSAIVFVLSLRNGQINSIDQLTLFERGTYPAVYLYPEYFLAGRIVSAIMGTGVVFMIYLLARKLGNERQSLLAAALAAFLPAMVADAHFATTDTPLMFWVTVALYLLIRTYDNWENDGLWAYAGAGFVCGLATSTKYNGIILIVPLIITPLLRIKSLDDLIRIRFLIGPISMAVGFIAGTPFALLNLPKFLGWFGYSLRLYNIPVEPILPAWQWHLKYHLTSPHFAILILGLIGFFLSFLYWGKRAVILNSFAIILWFAIFSQTNYQARMWLPTAPLFVLWTALLLNQVIKWLHEWLTPKSVSASFAYLPVLILVPLAFVSGTYGRNFQSGDVRSLASNWIMQNIPQGSSLAGDYFMPNIDTTIWPVIKTQGLFDHDLKWYREQGIEYLIMNEVVYDFDRLPQPAFEQHQALIANLCQIGVIHGQFIATTDADIKIYSLNPCAESNSITTIP